MSTSLNVPETPKRRRSPRALATPAIAKGREFMHGGVPINIGPVGQRPSGMEYHPPRVIEDDLPPEVRVASSARAIAQFEASLPAANGELGMLRPMLASMAGGHSVMVNGFNFNPKEALPALAKSEDAMNTIAAEMRAHARWFQTMAPGDEHAPIDFNRLGRSPLFKGSALAKAVLDVGTSQNYGSITGGQSLGYFSLDTRMARGTVRPDSFTLYQALSKSAAYQVVDYWPYVDDPGGALPGSATSGFSNVSSGTLATNAGIYSLQSINLKLMLDGRAVTLALMAQNNFVSVNEQENANAALTVLQTANWLNYHGNPTLFPNQFVGLGSSTPTANIFDFLAFYNANAMLQSWSTSQALYNMIYETSAVITSWGRFGRITHALMTPTTAGALQSLVTTLLNQVTNLPRGDGNGLIVNGDLQGILTRMGPIQFPLDLTITARDTPAQGQPRSNATTPTTTVNPTAPTGVVISAVSGAGTGSNWSVNFGGYTQPFVSGTARYVYAVASTDVNMNESVLAFSNTLAGSGLNTTGAVNVAIAGPAAADATAFRVFRSGSGPLGSATVGSPFSSGANSPTAFKYIGTIAASGTGTVNFLDYNGKIPGSENIYLLDLREEDGALDFRYLLPLTRIELFAQNLYMPWAVASIGAIRNRIPKFHGIITNFVPDSPVWNPVGANQ